MSKHKFPEEQFRVTLVSARDNIGAEVVYEPYVGYQERGRIESVGERYVMINYAGSVKATHPGDLSYWAGAKS